QHARRHDPGHRKEDPVGGEPFYPPGAEGLVTADYQASTLTGQLVEQETPDSFRVGGGPQLGWVKPATAQVGVPVQAEEPVRFEHSNPVGVEAAAQRPERQLGAPPTRCRACRPWNPFGAPGRTWAS